MRWKLNAAAHRPVLLLAALSGAAFAQVASAASEAISDTAYKQRMLRALPDLSGEALAEAPVDEPKQGPYLLLAANDKAQAQQPVGQAPPARREKKPEVESIPDIGGVLTPQDVLVLEPAWQYTHASVNRLTFRGVEILDFLLLGTFDAEDIDKDTMAFFLTGRYGITNRLEAEVKIPYIYRKDRTTASVTSQDPSDPDVDRDIEDGGLGDIEIAGHYQMNRGGEGVPYFTGNLRYKSTSGKGPFDVDTDDAGINTELPTGSGFHSIEASVTILYPSDPAVYFLNLGYLFNLEDDINEASGSNVILEVDPGDSIRFNFGMGLSINQKSSLTIGYKNDFIDNTKVRSLDSLGVITETSSRSLNVGSLLLGWSFQLDQTSSINVGLEMGVTDDAPDVSLTMRLPFRL